MVSFGRFELDPAQFRLTRDGTLVPLSPRPFDLLTALVARAGDLVTREELLSTVWKDMAVEPSSLNAAMSVLRQAMGPEAADLIETVPGRGYRFLGRIDRTVTAPGPATLLPTAVLDAPATLSVAIVDDHAIVRVGVRTIVERIAGCRVIGEAGTVGEAAAMIAALQPELLILDLMIGSDASLPHIARWRETAAMRVIVLSMYEEDQIGREPGRRRPDRNVDERGHRVGLDQRRHRHQVIQGQGDRQIARPPHNADRGEIAGQEKDNEELGRMNGMAAGDLHQVAERRAVAPAEDRVAVDDRAQAGPRRPSPHRQDQGAEGQPPEIRQVAVVGQTSRRDGIANRRQAQKRHRRERERDNPPAVQVAEMLMKGGSLRLPLSI